MRRPAFRKAVKGAQISKTASVPAPIRGWNTKDPLAEMDPTFAVNTENWTGRSTDVRVRRGNANHVTGISGQVESLMPYNAQGGTQKLFGAAGSSIYDFTTAGGVGSAVVGSLSNARWQHVNFTNSAGDSYLCCFNGADAPQYWDGSSWIAITASSSPAIVGVTATTLINACVFKRRLYLVAVNSLSLYYLPIDSVGGTVNATRLDGYFSKGGYIVSCETWTVDGGEGFDDHLVVVSSEGQVAVFKGTNPSSASSWALAGVWNLGEPIGRRCMIKYKSDVTLLTVEGVVPLAKALQSSQIDPSTSLTFNIQEAIQASSEAYKSNFGWEMTVYPQDNQLILNVPVREGSEQQQYVMNTLNGSWWRWTGLAANCWAISNEIAYFGTDGGVQVFGTVYADVGANISTDIQQAYSYLGSRGRLKSLKSARPNILANGNPSVFVGVSIDFNSIPVTNPASFTPLFSGIWDSGTWDSAVWSGDISTFTDWQTVFAVGTACGLRVKTVSNGLDLRLAATDYLYEFGGVVG